MITPYRPAKIVDVTGRTNCRLSPPLAICLTHRHGVSADDAATMGWVKAISAFLHILISAETLQVETAENVTNSADRPASGNAGTCHSGNLSCRRSTGQLPLPSRHGERADDRWMPPRWTLVQYPYPSGTDFRHAQGRCPSRVPSQSTIIRLGIAIDGQDPKVRGGNWPIARFLNEVWGHRGLRPGGAVPHSVRVRWSRRYPGQAWGPRAWVRRTKLAPVAG